MLCVRRVHRLAELVLVAVGRLALRVEEQEDAARLALEQLDARLVVLELDL